MENINYNDVCEINAVIHEEFDRYAEQAHTLIEQRQLGLIDDAHYDRINEHLEKTMAHLNEIITVCGKVKKLVAPSTPMSRVFGAKKPEKLNESELALFEEAKTIYMNVINV